MVGTVSFFTILYTKNLQVMFVYSEDCQIYFEALENTGNSERDHIQFEHLVPVQPSIDDQARVIYGEDTGIVGTIISMDKDDLVLRTNEGERHMKFESSEKFVQNKLIYLSTQFVINHLMVLT